MGAPCLALHRAQVVGTAVYAYGITSIISMISGINRSQMQLMQQKDVLNHYMMQIHAPPDLKDMIREWFLHYERASLTFGEKEILNMVSPGLRARLSSITNEPLIRRIPFFAHAEESCILEIVLILEPLLFSPGELIVVQATLELCREPIMCVQGCGERVDVRVDARSEARWMAVESGGFSSRAGSLPRAGPAGKDDVHHQEWQS